MDEKERLARLETNIEFMKDLLTEIREDQKNHPSKEEYNKLEDRVNKLENSRNSLAVTVGVISGIISIIVGFFSGVVTRYFMK